MTSDQLLSVVALRLTINQRGEALLTTTPVVDLTRPSTTNPLYFPQLADGGGYTTSLVLMNTSSSIETGRLSIFADDGSALPVRQLNGTSGSSFPYLILPGEVYVFQTDASPAVVKTGWVELTPDGGTPAPAAAGIFQYSRNGILLTESWIPPANLATHARVFVDLSGGHDTGLALCNPGYTRLDISLTAFQMDGVN